MISTGSGNTGGNRCVSPGQLVDAGRLFDAFQTSIDFTSLFNKAAVGQVLQLFVAAQPQHFFTATDGVLHLQACVDLEKEFLELADGPSRQYIYQFICYVVSHPT